MQRRIFDRFGMRRSSMTWRDDFAANVAEGTANYALCVEEKRACILLMANSARAEAIFVTLVQRLLGDAPIPASWEGYAPARCSRPVTS